MTISITGEYNRNSDLIVVANTVHERWVTISHDYVKVRNVMCTWICILRLVRQSL